jgi:transposase-like protein
VTLVVILAGVQTLLQHIHHIHTQPEDYRPDRCTHCGKNGLWCHGSYSRKANRRGLERDIEAPVSIPRYRCPECGGTCSCLPEAVPPRRHYLWDVQQQVLLLLLNGLSLNKATQRLAPSRHTIRRWWQRLKQRFTLDASLLRSDFPVLGRTPTFDEFWRACLARMRFSQAMLVVHRSGAAIP